MISSLQKIRKVFPRNIDLSQFLLRICPETCKSHRSQQALKGQGKSKEFYIHLQSVPLTVVKNTQSFR